MDRRRYEKNITSKEYKRTSQVLGRGRLLLSYLRQPPTIAPGPSGEYPVSNMFFVNPIGRQNRLIGLVPVRRHSSTVTLEPILSAGSLEALSPVSSSDSLESGSYHDAWSMVDESAAHIAGDESDWLMNTTRWLERYGYFMALGVAGVFALGYTLARTYKFDM